MKWKEEISNVRLCRSCAWLVYDSIEKLKANYEVTLITDISSVERARDIIDHLLSMCKQFSDPIDSSLYYIEYFKSPTGIAYNVYIKILWKDYSPNPVFVEIQKI